MSIHINWKKKSEILSKKLQIIYKKNSLIVA